MILYMQSQHFQIFLLSSNGIFHPSIGWASILDADVNWCWAHSKGSLPVPRYRFSRGVCGKCATEGKTIIVQDVELFPGHIACSSLSKSEIVVPLIKEGHLFGVLDVDSPEKGRFGEGERVLLERAASLISDSNLPEHLKVFAERE